ncbi:hypothetical protein WJ23_18135 [Burkholderia lata]|uniref:hypothetical protein n=1 Tax=Burkholderia lata (strain ATCC 17760 / DSM 23089 / LMG 22485 / NCIMB 9086 / R18194 / 383) TaxID=482957 RepID=UPI000841F0F6|nr:hypothetical protein [Burkholderia lata]AOJ39909.1 hypothetical protein WJ23_18135 [Burkholderia lata]
MNRHDFVAQRPVADFVTWLAEHLPTLPVQLRFARSKFVPGGLDLHVNGIENVLANYCWNSAWIDPSTGRRMESHDWRTTRASLRQLGILMRAAVASGDDGRAGAIAREILRWGGVFGAIPFIESKVRNRTFCAYLQSLERLFALDGSQTTHDLHARNVHRFDAGLTKVHALLDTTGSPIYDSRVGAALAMLYELFRHDAGQSGVHHDSLAFPSGQARGDQIRDPGDLGFAAAPQFYTHQVPAECWARWQVRAGWIIRAVLERTTLFAGEPHGDDVSPIAARCHAFEAALFMIGYDIRNLTDGDRGGDVGHPTDEPPRSTRRGNWVPTGHPFKDTLSTYCAYLDTGPAIHDANAFRQWLDRPEHASRYESFRNNFGSYCYPFGERELNLYDRSLKDVKEIAKGGETGLHTANYGECEFIPGDERAQVVLVDAGLAGYCKLADTTPAARRQRLIAGGFAGTENSAETLMTVGRNVGRHFELLDSKDRPTALFFRFFGEGFDEFRQRLRVDRDGRDPGAS